MKNPLALLKKLDTSVKDIDRSVARLIEINSPQEPEPEVIRITIPPARTISLVLCEFNQADIIYKRLKALQHDRCYKVNRCYNLVATLENRIGYIPVECASDEARDTLEADATYIPGIIKVDILYV